LVVFAIFLVAPLEADGQSNQGQAPAPEEFNPLEAVACPPVRAPLQALSVAFAQTQLRIDEVSGTCTVESKTRIVFRLRVVTTFADQESGSQTASVPVFVALTDDDHVLTRRVTALQVDGGKETPQTHHVEFVYEYDRPLDSMIIFIGLLQPRGDS
nr:hypothetical protein [Alphaproteobacteria bacterium]